MTGMLPATVDTARLNQTVATTANNKQPSSDSAKTSRLSNMPLISPIVNFVRSRFSGNASGNQDVRQSTATDYSKGLTPVKPNSTTLECFYHWEKQIPEKLYLSQPLPSSPKGEGHNASVQAKTDNITWGRFSNDVRKMAAHLQSLGLEKGSSVAIFSRNTAYYQEASLAINLAGYVSVPLHAEMQSKEIAHALEDSNVQAMFVGKLDNSNYEKLQNVEQAKDIHQVAMPLSPSDLAEKVPVAEGKSQAQWDDVLASTAPMTESPVPEKDALATIVYTSGSSGLPKGVEHTYGSMSSALESLTKSVDIKPTDRMLAHLMLSHVAERAAVETSFYQPMTIYFSESPKTLKDELPQVKPTLFLTIPKIWAALDDAVADKAAKSFLRFLTPGVKDPHKKLDRLFNYPLVGNLFRHIILKKMGLGEARGLLSGAGPISAEIAKRYHVGQGYGATENFARVTIDPPGSDIRYGTVGQVSPGVEYRLEDPETGQPAEGKGELLVKSDSLMRGYHNLPEKTKETISEDGFFRTGDLVSVDNDGYLKILGRLSSNFKNKNGVFINSGQIQEAVKKLGSPYFEDAFVFYDKSQDKPALAAQLTVVGYKKLDAQDPMYDPKFKTEVMAKLNEAHAEFNKTWPAKHEHLSHSVLAAPWTQENGLLNSTNKPKAPALKQHYGDLLDQMSDRSAGVVDEIALISAK